MSRLSKAQSTSVDWCSAAILPRQTVDNSQVVLSPRVAEPLSVGQDLSDCGQSLRQPRNRSDWSGGRLTARQTTGDTSPDEQDLSRVLELLDDEHVRTILAATSAEPCSAGELAEYCGISASNIYRRLSELQELNLLREQTRPRPNGNHESVYTAELSALELRFEDGDMTWSLTRKESDIADELTRMWQNFE